MIENESVWIDFYAIYSNWRDILSHSESSDFKHKSYNWSCHYMESHRKNVG